MILEVISCSKGLLHKFDSQRISFFDEVFRPNISFKLSHGSLLRILNNPGQEICVGFHICVQFTCYFVFRVGRVRNQTVELLPDFAIQFTGKMSTNSRVETAFFILDNPTIFIKHPFKVQRPALDLTFVHFYGITPPIAIAVGELRKELNCVSFIPLKKIPICFIKGQLISKCPFGVFKFPKKPTKFL